MLRVTIAVAMILAIVLLVVKTSVVRQQALSQALYHVLGQLCTGCCCWRQCQMAPDELVAMRAGR
jgi:hypothetical protein